MWQNEYTPADNSVGISLIIFAETEDGLYERMEEEFREVAVEQSAISDMLSGAGFDVLEVSEYLGGDKISDTTEKLFFAARKK